MKNYIILFFIALVAVANGQSLWISEDFGTSWMQSKLDLPENLQINHITFQNKDIWLGSESHGLFRNQEPIGAFLPGKKINAVYSTKSGVYISIYLEGLFFTSNGGYTWTHIDESEVRDIQAHDLFILLATDKGILKQRDGIFMPVFEGDQVNTFASLDSLLFAGSSQGLLLSKDYGESWKYVMKQSAVFQLSVIGSAIYTSDLTGQVIVSEDYGQNWKALGIKGFYDLLLMNGNLILTNDEGIFQSKDEGRTWEKLASFDGKIPFEIAVKEDILYLGLRE